MYESYWYGNIYILKMKFSKSFLDFKIGPLPLELEQVTAGFLYRLSYFALSNTLINECENA